MSYPKDIDEYSQDEILIELERRYFLRARGNCDYCGRSLGAPACKLPERHEGKVGVQWYVQVLQLDDHEGLYINDILRWEGDRATPLEVLDQLSQLGALTGIKYSEKWVTKSMQRKINETGRLPRLYSVLEKAEADAAH